MALRHVRSSGSFEVSAILTTLTRDFERISMHGVRLTLLEKQAESIGLPLEKVWIGKGAANGEYESQMSSVLARHREEGVDTVVFGDLFLQDIRRYREEMLAKIGMHGVFPLWGLDTGKLARDFIDSGFRAILCCVDSKRLDRTFCGSEFDLDLVARLPANVDPCGENGEFHTFVYDGPTFKKGIDVRVDGVVSREGFFFAEILDANTDANHSGGSAQNGHPSGAVDPSLR